MLGKIILLIFTMVFFVNIVSAKNSDWVGIYTFDEESWDENRVRTSTWFRLEIKDEKGKLVGIYSDGVNGKTSRRFQIKVKANETTAKIYYQHWLQRIAGVNGTSTDSEFVSGDLLFEFEKVMEKGKPIIYTIWRKMNLAKQTESQKIGNRIIFFRKVEQGVKNEKS